MSQQLKIPGVRLTLSVLVYQAGKILSPGSTQFLIDKFSDYLANSGYEAASDLLMLQHTDHHIAQALDKAQSLFEQSLKTEEFPHLRGIETMPIKGVPDLEQAISQLSANLTSDSLRLAIRQVFDNYYGSVLSSSHIDEATVLYEKCLDKALATNQQLMQTLYRQQYEFREESKRSFEHISNRIENIDNRLEKFHTNNQKFRPSPKPQNYIFSKEYSTLIGRNELVHSLCQFVRQDESLHGRVAVIYGPSGIGKTSIATEVAGIIKDEKSPEGSSRTVVSLSTHESVSDPAEVLDDLIVRLSIILGGGGETDTPKHQIEHVRLQLEKNRVLIIIDDFRDEVASEVMRFLNDIPNHTKVILTRNQPLLHSSYIYSVPVEGLNKHFVKPFLANRCHVDDITEDQIIEIHENTGGNPSALVEFARLIEQDGINRAVKQLPNMMSAPGSRAADKLIGSTLRRLPSDLMRSLLKAQAIFRYTARPAALFYMAEQHNKDITFSEVENALTELCRRGLLIQEENTYRIAMSHVRRYLRQTMRQESELDVWRNRWVDYYCEVRERKQDLNDEAGWTIYSDYRMESYLQEMFTDQSEAGTIIDILRFCLSDKRSFQYWGKAAKILDGFRAVLFAAGYWQKRIEFCLQIIDHAEELNNMSTVAQCKRLLAWIYCFRDEYAQAIDTAKESLRIADDGMSLDSIPKEASITHAQTYYKSLVTLGQVALRKGQEDAINGQVERRAGDPQDALYFFRRAKEQFEQARIYLSEARGFIRAKYPREQLIVDFYLAEVDYYDRHSIEIQEERLQAQLTIQVLEESRLKFEELLTRAEVHGDISERERTHVRLAAYCNYYLGKINRRIAIQSSESERGVDSMTFAEFHFNECESIASKYKDRVLSARLRFAIGQWHESGSKYFKLIQFDQLQPTIGKARENVDKAITELDDFGMDLESRDALAFLTQRLRQ